jgi:hypothetical protein
MMADGCCQPVKKLPAENWADVAELGYTTSGALVVKNAHAKTRGEGSRVGSWNLHDLGRDGKNKRSNITQFTMYY